MARPDNVEQRARRREMAALVVLVVVAIGLIGYLVARGDATSPTGTPAATPGSPAADGQAAVGPLGDVARRQEGDPLAIGRVDAPVTMVMFADYRCPFCAAFSRETEPRLIEEYVTDGRLRIEWRDFPVFGAESALAAQAGRAAAEQGRFWEFTEAVYDDSPERAHPDLPEERLIGYAEQVGVPDIARFRSDMHSPRIQQAVQQDLMEGTLLGISGTPAFVVNGYPVMGAQPIDRFRALIDRNLAAAS